MHEKHYQWLQSRCWLRLCAREGVGVNVVSTGVCVDKRKKAASGIRQCKYKLIRTGDSASFEIIKCIIRIQQDQAAHRLRVIVFGSKNWSGSENAGDGGNVIRFWQESLITSTRGRAVCVPIVQCLFFGAAFRAPADANWWQPCVVLSHRFYLVQHVSCPLDRYCHAPSFEE